MISCWGLSRFDKISLNTASYRHFSNFDDSDSAPSSDESDAQPIDEEPDELAASDALAAPQRHRFTFLFLACSPKKPSVLRLKASDKL